MRGHKVRQPFPKYKHSKLILCRYSLGYAELYLTLAYFATFFDYELHETAEENITVTRDRGVPFPEKGHLMVKAKVVKVLRDPYAA